MKLVSENLNNFVRNQDPKKALNLGYEAKIRNFFRQYNVPDENYEVKENGEIIFYKNLQLYLTNINQLPDNLTIYGSLDLWKTDITNLPNNLNIKGYLDIGETNITSLPNDLIIDKYIFVDQDQTKLLNWIKNSKFKNKLKI